jgi:two-component system phosphate regulon sensor histidine kinase PhoR
VRDHEIDGLVRSSLKETAEKTGQLEAGGRKRFLRVIAAPLKGKGEGGALALFQDLSQLHSLQTMRREFVGNVSHELRTPLATIKAIVETLEDGAIDNKEEALGFLKRVDSEVDRMTQLVSELTELSRIETGRADLNITPMDMNDLVEAVANQLKPQTEREELKTTTELATGLPLVPADSGRIRQVLVNLLHNATKFTPRGGHIKMSTTIDGNSVVVSIADSGIGISEEDLPHIFQRFYKADKARSGGGTGLGLAIAKHIVQAHNGSIWAESVEGKGSTFFFRLPLTARK